ncbi:MAG: glycosyltransferase [Halobacteria archaeon]
MDVSTFTDTYLPNINGATYTISLWKEKWNEGYDGRMTVTYPGSSKHESDRYEYPVRSLPFPFYEGMKLGLPLPTGLGGLFRVLARNDRVSDTKSRFYDDSYLGYTSILRRGSRNIRGSFSDTEDTYLGILKPDRPLSGENSFRLPDDVCDADIIHVHSPFALGMAGAQIALSKDLPLVVNYHTPTDEYVKYITDNESLKKRLKAINDWWEQRYLTHADVVITPSRQARAWLDDKGVEREKVVSLPNGIDTEFFRPLDSDDFKDRYGLESPVIGYCGRHGYEKRLDDVVEAATLLDDDVDVVLVGDGPARTDFMEQAKELGVDDMITFPGFIEREALPEFYSSLDAFVFPSDAETEGLVALEATACGTPVVAADARGLKNTVKHGNNGYRYEPGEIDKLVEGVRYVLDRQESLSSNCLDMRSSIKVENTIDKLKKIYVALNRDGGFSRECL